MPKGPTVYDVAERAGVSIATVSFAFRRPEKVKASTRETVLAAARELGYVPSASARGLAHGRTRALGLFAFEYLLESADQPLVVPGAASPVPPVPAADDDVDEDFRLFPLYVDEVQRGVELECWRRGYALMVGGRGHAKLETVLADIAGRVDGLAVFPHTVPGDVLGRIAWRIPVVELSENPHGDELNHVTVDNVAGMRALTNHLISVHGLREFAFVGDTAGSDQLARFQGFQAALGAAGLAVPAAVDRPSGWGHPAGVRHRRRAAGRRRLPARDGLRDRPGGPGVDGCAPARRRRRSTGRCCHRVRRYRRRPDHPPDTDHRPATDGTNGSRRGRHPDRSPRKPRSTPDEPATSGPRRASGELRLPASLGL